MKYKQATLMAGLLLALGCTEALTGKTIVVQPIPAEDIDTVRQIALHDSGRVAIIGELTQGLIAKGTAPQKLSYFSLYDAAGKVIQDFYSDLPGNTSLAGVTFGTKGNSYVLGDATDLPAGIPGNEVFIKQFGPDSKSGWLKILSRQQDGKSDDRAAAVAADGQGNIYTLLTSRGKYEQQAGDLDAVLVKLDSNGKPLWIRQLGTPGADEAVALSLTSTGQVVVALNQVEKVRSGRLYALDAEGKLRAETALGSGERIYGLTGGDGSPLVAGQRATGGKNVAFLSRFSAELEPLWTQFWADGNSAYTAVALAPSGEIYVGGRSDSGGNIHVLLRRYAADGQPQDALVLDSAGEDNLHSLAVSQDGKVWAGGSIYQAGKWSGWLSSPNATLDQVTPFELQAITLEGAGSKAVPNTARPVPQGMFKP